MDILTQIKPVPKFATQGSGSATLGMLGKPNFRIETKNIETPLAKQALRELETGLAGAFACGKEKFEGDLTVTLEISDKIPEQITKNKDQAYKITVSSDGVSLTGFGEAGLYYAVTTLLQCVETSDNSVSVPEMTVVDFPDLKTRGHFVECRFGTNLMELEDWKSVIDDMVSMKMNQLIVALYGCWCVQYDGIISEYVYIPVEKYPKLKTNVIKKYYSPKNKKWINETVGTPIAEKDFFGELIAYGKLRGVEVAPLWNSYGHNTLIPRMYPEVSAKHNGEPCGHGYCISSEKTYNLLFGIFDMIIDKYLAPNGIKTFHIGMDEVRDEIATNLNDFFDLVSGWCDCEDCSKLTNEEKFLNHAIKLISHLKSRGMENIYIYSDMLTKIIDPVKFKSILEKNDLLDVTVIDWWTYTNNKENLMFSTMHPELGLRATIKPWNSYYHWNATFDTVPNVRLLAEMAHEEGHVEGLQSYAAWDRSCDKNHVSMADYSWNFEGTGSVEEYNARYVKREFGARYEEAKRALDIMDEITSEKRNDFDRFGRTSSQNSIMGNVVIIRTLTYYFYSYVKIGKPYPRNFPGEAFSIILEKRDVYEKTIKLFSERAREALEIFESLSKDFRCNVSLAERFACEVHNYMCVCEDYLALFKIYDVMNSKERNEKTSKLISGIAKARKLARTELMLRIENVKEAYLIPSHLRNQSIFMQVFADIEAYVNSTEPQKLQLDVCDMREIGSTAFFNLR